MKKLLLFFLVCNFAFIVPSFVYAQDQIIVEKLTIKEKIDKFYNDFMSSEMVTKSITSIKINWEKFKNWISNLPGIRDYNNSVYSDKNWKKTMNSMSGEYSPHLQKDSQGVEMVKEGKKQWDKL